MSYNDTCVVLKSIVARCLSRADNSSLSSMRCAVEELTDSTIIFQHGYHLDPGDAIVIESKGHGFYEIFYNPTPTPNPILCRLSIAHELYHVLANCQTSDISEVIHFCNRDNLDEESLAHAFSAITEIIRPKVTTRKVKTSSEIENIKAIIYDKDAGAGDVLSEIIEEKLPLFSFEPPLRCNVCKEIITGGYYHKDYHNIAVNAVYP